MIIPVYQSLYFRCQNDNHPTKCIFYRLLWWLSWPGWMKLDRHIVSTSSWHDCLQWGMRSDAETISLLLHCIFFFMCYFNRMSLVFINSIVKPHSYTNTHTYTVNERGTLMFHLQCIWFTTIIRYYTIPLYKNYFYHPHLNYSLLINLLWKGLFQTRFLHHAVINDGSLAGSFRSSEDL